MARRVLRREGGLDLPPHDLEVGVDDRRVHLEPCPGRGIVVGKDTPRLEYLHSDDGVSPCEIDQVRRAIGSLGEASHQIQMLVRAERLRETDGDVEVTVRPQATRSRRSEQVGKQTV